MNETTISQTITKNCSRRNFIKEAVTGLGTIAIGTFTVQFLTSCSTSNTTGPSNNDEIELKVDLSLTENSALTTVGGTLALTSNDIDNSGLLLIRQSETAIRVFSRECTHNNCTIDAFSNGKSVCQCHGSEFDTNGSVLKGPATSSLKEYNASLENNIVTIS